LYVSYVAKYLYNDIQNLLGTTSAIRHCGRAESFYIRTNLYSIDDGQLLFNYKVSKGIFFKKRH
jgi:hypothetical protein